MAGRARALQGAFYRIEAGTDRLMGGRRGRPGQPPTPRSSEVCEVFINLVDNARLDPLGFSPFGRVVEGMDVVDGLHTGYGEGAPFGRGPDWERINAEGNAYLEREFRLLDYVVEARVVER